MINFQGRTGNYAQAGNAAANDLVKSFAAARRSGPNYGKMVQDAANFRSAEKKASIQAQSQVAQTGINAAGELKAHNIKVDARENLRGAKRKAGVLAAGGKLIAGAGDAFKETPKYESTSLDYSGMISKLREEAGSLYDQVGKGGTKGSSDTSTGDTKPSTPSSGKPISSGEYIKQTGKSGSKGGKYSQQDMTKFALDAGFNPEQAKIMGAIGMGESGGDAGVDTSMTIDPGKKNEYSIGLFQINAQAHGDKLSKLGYTEDDLRDPVKNAKVAKLVHDEVGGFGPWSVYSKGIYKNYL